MKAHLKRPPEVLPTCLPSQQLSLHTVDDADDGIMHVAFYDTRPRSKLKLDGMLRAAALLNSSRVRFHALLMYPRDIPGMRVTKLKLPKEGECLYQNLRRLAHGPGPQYLYKPLLHWVFPPDVKRVVVLDSDVVVLRPLEMLWAEFDRFSPSALLGIANEQSSLYASHAIGKNGGVQLLHLQRMRGSTRYAQALDQYASGRDTRWLGYLGDQTLYSFMAYSHPDLFYNLGCEWNRQLSMQFGFRNESIHACPAGCGLLHANFAILKCVARTMQVSPSCEVWQRLRDGKVDGCPAGRRGEFRRATAKYFSDCCIPRSTPNP